jgi:hypothetical protein
MKSYSSPFSPEMFNGGEIASASATHDEYFGPDFDADNATRIVLDDFVNLLPEWKRSAVQMCIMSKLTYEEAAERISVMRGVDTHKKTVWRWAHQGVEQMKEWLVKSAWVGTLTGGKIPVDVIDLNVPVRLPSWEDG